MSRQSARRYGRRFVFNIGDDERVYAKPCIFGNICVINGPQNGPILLRVLNTDVLEAFLMFFY